VAELDAAVADEAALLRAAYNLRADARLPVDIAGGPVGPGPDAASVVPGAER
jgi:hypothetical protein